MSKDNLDLSQVSVTDLFNDSGNAAVPAPDSGTDGAGDDGDGGNDPDDGDGVDPTLDTGDDGNSDGDPTPDTGDGDDNGNGDAGNDPTPTPNSDSSDDNDDESIISELQAKLGYEIDKEFDESIEGLTEFTKATAEKMAQEQIQNLFGAYPDVQEYLNFRANGGDPKKYFQTAAPERDFSVMEIKEGDLITQKQVVGAFLQSQGFEADEIKETLEDYEDAGILERHAKKALVRLQNTQAAQKEALLEQQQQQAQKAAQDNERMWGEINALVQRGTLKGLSIPERDKKRFFSWMASPIDNQGNSQRSIDRSKLDQETLLALEYIVYKGFDLSKLVANNNTTQKARSLRSKLSKGTSSTNRLKSSKPGYTKATKLPDLKDLL